MHSHLIAKYGEDIEINEVGTKAYLEDSRKSYYFHKMKSYTSFNIEVIHTVEEINLDDILTLRGDSFGVLETSPVRTTGVTSYAETVLYLDDFLNEIVIKKQSLSTLGCNLPDVNEEDPLQAMARIKTTKPSDFLQYSMQGQKVITHIFCIRYIEDISKSDLLEWNSRKFEIISIENLNETDTLLYFNCIEVL